MHNDHAISSNNHYDSDELTMLDYYYIIKKRKTIIGIIVTAVTTISIVYCIFATNIYSAEATIMPIGGGGGGLSGIAAQISGLPFIDAINMGGSKTNSYMAILRSRALAEKIIKKYGVMQVLFSDLWNNDSNNWKTPDNPPNIQNAIDCLFEHLNFTENKKTGIITIASEFSDPEFAAVMANAYVDGLRDFINNNTLTMAKKNRLFIEKQLAENKKNVLNVGKDINEFYKEGRVSDVESRVDVVLTVDEDILNYGLINEELQSNNNVWNMLVKNKEIIQRQLDETNIARDIPQQVYLQYLMLRRELLGKMNSLLAQQYEIAKIDEAKENLEFQVIDFAYVPEKKIKPKKRQIVMISFVSSVFLALVLVFLLEYINKVRMHYNERRS